MPHRPFPFISCRPFLWVIILSVFVFVTHAYGAKQLVIEQDRQFDFAAHLFSTQEYESAAAEYERFVYFFPDSSRVDEAKYMAGMGFFKAGQWEKAKKRFNTLAFPFKDTAISASAYFMLSRCHLQMGRPHQAAADLRNLIALTAKDPVKERACYELGWIHIDSGLFDTLPDCFNTMGVDKKQAYKIDRLMPVLSGSDDLEYKNPKLAGILSGIVPGSGQLYIERPRDALTAFLVNAGLILAAYTAFDDDNDALGSVISFVEFGFYAGNIYGAASGAHKYNKNLKNRYIKYLNQNFRVGFAPSGHKNPAVLFRFDF